MSEHNLIRAECDHCGADLFVVYFDTRRLVIECDACGCQLQQRIAS